MANRHEGDPIRYPMDQLHTARALARRLRDKGHGQATVEDALFLGGAGYARKSAERATAQVFAEVPPRVTVAQIVVLR